MTDKNSPKYQLRYSLTREDIAAFEFLPRELQGAEKLWLFAPVLACGAAAGLFEAQLKAVLPWDPGTRWGQVATVMIAVGIGYGLSLLLLTARARIRISRAPLPASATAVDAFSDRVTVTADGEPRTLAWRDVAVSASDRHVFLTYAPRDAIIIPLRAFPDLAAMRSFATFAEAMGRDETGNADQGRDPTRHNYNKEAGA